MSLVHKITFRGENTNLIANISQSKPVIKQQETAVQNNNEYTNKVSQETKKAVTVAYISSALGIISMGVAGTMMIKGRKKLKNNEEIINHFKKQASEFIEPKIDKVETYINKELADISQKLGDIKTGLDTRFQGVYEKIQEKTDWFDGVNKDFSQKISSLNNAVANQSSKAGPKNLKSVDNLNLLARLDEKGDIKTLNQSVIDELNKAASKYIYTGGDKTPLTRTSSFWSMTAESIPEKEGGLAEVPVQLSKNMTSAFGIKNKLVRPMIEIPGKSKLEMINGEYTYWYNLDKATPFNMPVKKLAEFETTAFRNNETVRELIEVYTGTDKQGCERIMFRNAPYFGFTSGLYKESPFASEVERYAFFPKVAYQFLEYLVEGRPLTSMKVFDSAELSKIDVPGAIVLNDFHAAGMAGLLRLRAPLEKADGVISSRAEKILKSINLVDVVHNNNYEGETWTHTENVLNTLFDQYAYDAYKHSNTGFLDDGRQKVLTVYGGVNLSNIAKSLANKTRPVSYTYGKWMGEMNSRGHNLQLICAKRFEAGTLKGESNGWDRVVNEISSEKLKGFNDALNNDKITLFLNYIKNISGLSKEKQRAIIEVLNNEKDGINSKNLLETVVKLKELDFPAVNKTLNELEQNDIFKLRSFMPYTNKDSIEVIEKNHLHNKTEFTKWLNSVVEHDKRNEKIFGIAETELTDLSGIDMNNLDNTPYIHMGTRFVTQKGVDIASGTIKGILWEWEKRYPGKPKPLFVIGGVDAEGGKWREVALELKRSLGQDGKQIVYMDGYTPNNILQGGTDIAIYPSRDEPDGSKYEALYKGNIVVCTKVDGHIDSIRDGINGFLTARNPIEVENSGYDYLGTMVYDFKQAMYKALDTFFDKKARSTMIRNAIDSEQSWIQRNADNKIVGGPAVSYLEDLGYNLKDFPEIQVTANK